MIDPPTMTAVTQYNDMIGTAAADAGDFEGLADLLQIPDDQYVLGISVHAGHPLIDGTEPNAGATRSRTYLEAWTVSRIAWDGMPSGLPQWLSNGPRPLEVELYTPTLEAIDYARPTIDGISLLLRASKRLAVTLWIDEVVNAHLRPEDFKVTKRFGQESIGAAWQAVEDEY